MGLRFRLSKSSPCSGEAEAWNGGAPSPRLPQEHSGTLTSQTRIPPVLVLQGPIWVGGAPPAPTRPQLPAMRYPQWQRENNVLEIKTERTTTKKY